MKKVLISIMLISLLSACSKSKKDHCYHCEIIGNAGYYREIDTCADVTSDNFVFKTNTNGDASHTCTEK